MRIRDLYESKNAPLNKALESLNATVGIGFSVSIAWVDMFRDLKEKFPDRATLVPSIVEIVTVFIKRLESSLEEDEEFQDRFLNEVGTELMTKAYRYLSLKIHDSPKSKIHFNEFKDFDLFLPALDEQGYRSIAAGFGEDLTKVFDDDYSPKETIHPPPSVTIPTIPQDVGASNTGATRAPRVRALPSLKSLSRPETLFSYTLPYNLLVRRSGDCNIEVEGNHSPTLELIAGYFEKFARKSVHHTDGLPYYSVLKTTSPFGSGTYCDIIRIKRTRTYSDSVGTGFTLVLAFIEGTCGYDFVSSRDGEFFFRRTIPFIDL